MTRAAALLIASSALALTTAGTGCGSPQMPAESPETTSDKPTEGPIADAEEPAPAVVRPEKPFSEMKHGEQIAYMKNVVMPAMAKSFRDVAPDVFDTMNCATCHGSGAKNGSFKMPNPDLPALDVTDNFAVHMNDKPAVTKFMMEKVVPDMVTLLGEEPFNPQTGQGFGCFGCHTKK